MIFVCSKVNEAICRYTEDRRWTITKMVSRTFQLMCRYLSAIIYSIYEYIKKHSFFALGFWNHEYLPRTQMPVLTKPPSRLIPPSLVLCVFVDNREGIGSLAVPQFRTQRLQRVGLRGHYLK